MQQALATLAVIDDPTHNSKNRGASFLRVLQCRDKIRTDVFIRGFLPRLKSHHIFRLEPAPLNHSRNRGPPPSFVLAVSFNCIPSCHTSSIQRSCESHFRHKTHLPHCRRPGKTNPPRGSGHPQQINHVSRVSGSEFLNDLRCFGQMMGAV